MGSDPPHRDVFPPPGVELLARLDEEWDHLAASRRFRQRLQTWAAENPRLGFADGHALVAEAQRRDIADWHLRDRVLAALLERAGHDALAGRAALQIVLPAIRSLIFRVRRWDTEERTATVVTEALDVLDRCAKVAAQTAPHFRVYANTRRRVLRAATRDRGHPDTPADDMTAVANSPQRNGQPVDETAELRELIEWVTTRGGISERAAREVVLTRAGGVDVGDLARTLDISPDALRKRRHRTEQRLQRSLGIER